MEHDFSWLSLRAERQMKGLERESFLLFCANAANGLMVSSVIEGDRIPEGEPSRIEGVAVVGMTTYRLYESHLFLDRPQLGLLRFAASRLSSMKREQLRDELLLCAKRMCFRRVMCAGAISLHATLDGSRSCSLLWVPTNCQGSFSEVVCTAVLNKIPVWIVPTEAKVA